MAKMAPKSIVSAKSVFPEEGLILFKSATNTKSKKRDQITYIDKTWVPRPLKRKVMAMHWVRLPWVELKAEYKYEI